MTVLIITLIAILIFSIYLYLKKKLSYFEELGIPYYSGWTFMDNASDFVIRRRHFSEFVKDVYNIDQDAKYVGIYQFMRPVFVIRDPELIKSIAITNFDCFTDHRVFIDDTLDRFWGGNLLNLNGDKWKKMRNLLSPSFTSSKMKGMFELMIDAANDFINYIDERPEEVNRMIDTKDMFSKFTNDIIAACAFGVTVNSLKDPNNDFFVLGRKGTDIEKTKFKFLFFILFPKIVRLLKLKLFDAGVEHFFTNIVKETVAIREEKGITRPDMIQLMMDARLKDNDLDITEMTAQAFIFFFGGFDTTSTAMCVLAHELAVNPDIQYKLQDEIDKVIEETKGKPTYEAVMGMSYLDAVFQESLRRHPQLCILNRVCTKAFELPPALPGGKSITISPGTDIAFPTSGIHNDAKYYENPEKFNPDRFLNKKLILRSDQGTNLGFGIGPRGCIGNRFAIMETKLLFFLLLAKFNLKPNEKTRIPLIYDKNTFFIRAGGGFRLTFEKRNDKNNKKI